MVKRLSAVRETWVQSLGQEDLLEKGMATPAGVLAQPHPPAKRGSMEHWRRKWQLTPVLLPEESHGGRSLVGYSPWGRKELDTTERLHFTQ